MRKPRRKKICGEWLALMAVAFGLGLALSIFCSARFALLVAALGLIYLGATFRR